MTNKKNRTLAEKRYPVVEIILIKRIQKWLAALLLLAAPLVVAQSGSYVVSDIRVEGLQRISAGTVFSSMPIGVGDTADGGLIRASARALFGLSLIHI